MWIVWPFRKKNFGSAWTVCADFRHFAETSGGRFIIQDEASLPHPKTIIFDSICILLMSETDGRIVESAKTCAFELAFFQEGVGDKPLHPLGIDLDLLEAADASDGGGASVAKADPSGKERYDRFKQLRDADWARMQATMAKLQRRAKAS